MSSTAEEGVAPKAGGAAHRYPGARNPEFRRVLVTGAQGKVGVRVVQAFHQDSSGKPWEVVATDVARGVFDTPGAEDPWNYQQADLTDAGEVFSMVARFQPDAIVHIAAIPDIEHNAPHTVFANNITATFNGASNTPPRRLPPTLAVQLHWGVWPILSARWQAAGRQLSLAHAFLQSSRRA